MTVLDDCLGKIDQLNGYSFTWKNEEQQSEGLQYGLNADEVEGLNPDLIKMGDNGFKSVNYNGVLGVMLGAIKELKEEVAQLRSA